jgi:hypothetical protein
MPFSVYAPIVLMLHEGGWDEVAMVAVGLVAAYLVIVWTGRRSQHDDDEAETDGDLAEQVTDDQTRPT